MRIVIEEPPLIEQIDAAFHVRGQPILFAFGDTIYNPLGGEVTPELEAHEEVHGVRQGRHVLDWWDRYINDPRFRLAEEIPAHVAEFNKACEVNAHKWGNRRNMRRAFAASIARKLSAPLYGNLITFKRARELILSA